MQAEVLNPADTGCFNAGSAPQPGERVLSPTLHDTPARGPMPGRLLQRLVNKADFERLLSARSSGRSAHFALHHVAGAPWQAPGRGAGAGEENLSTEPVPLVEQPVDKFSSALWIGCVVPKRHARRAVTRTLLKRQVRGAFERHGALLPPGLWLVRLRSPFPRDEFPSARSAALAGAARGELDGLLRRACA